MYLLDTNVLSELRKRKPHGAVLAWFAGVPDRELRVSAVTLGEIQAGVERLREQNRDKADEIENWCEHIATSWNILPMDGETFRLWARLMHRRSDALSEDAMLAATAIRHRLVIATRNARDFRHFAVEILNPFLTPRQH